ncbi:MAG: hypothetical protein RLZZ292_807 [Bacteroidota bacterium]|jgi:long-subunit fatty acid transport protein
MRKIILLSIFLTSFFTIQAQTAADALRYSSTQSGIGTARSIGVGGALGALGADFGSLSVNPAGVGNFRRSEFLLTPGYHSATVTSQLKERSDEKGFGQNLSDKEVDAHFTLNNWGLVLTSHPQNGEGNWKTFNFAVGANRLNNYNQSFYVEGASKGSITDRFLEEANTTAPGDLDPYSAGLAYQTGAIFGESPTNYYLSDFDNTQEVLVKKVQTAATSGRMKETIFSLGGNYKDRVSLGVTVGISSLRYKDERIYTQTDPRDAIPAFNELNFTEKLTTTGTGVNVKLGLIYKVTDALRMGAAVHSSSLISMQDLYSNTMFYNYTQDGQDVRNSAESGEGNFNYRLVTPWKAIGSAAYMIGQKGFISTDIEYVDYTSMRFDYAVKDNGAEYKTFEREVNNRITSTYKAAANIHVGGEVLVGDFRYRLGLGLLGSPYKTDSGFDTNYNFGVGLRQQYFFADLGYQVNIIKQGLAPYSVQNGEQPYVAQNLTKSNLVLTFGFKF